MTRTIEEMKIHNGIVLLDKTKIHAIPEIEILQGKVFNGFSDGDYIFWASNGHYIMVEFYQKKHSPTWPGNYQGEPGSTFPFGVDDTIKLAKELATKAPLSHSKPTDTNPPLLCYDASEFDTLKKYKKISQVCVYAGFQSDFGWKMHFYPK